MKPMTAKCSCGRNLEPKRTIQWDRKGRKFASVLLYHKNDGTLGCFEIAAGIKVKVEDEK